MIKRMLLLVFACGGAFAGSLRQHDRILAINEDNDRYFLAARRDPNLLTADGARGYFDSVAAGGAVTHFFMLIRSTSPPKSACPGVSRILIFVPL